MKKLLLIISILSIFGCTPKIDNSVENLNKILKQDKFNLERGICSSYGSEDFRFEIEKVELNYQLKLKGDNHSKILSQDQINSLSSLIETRLKKNDNDLSNLCTATNSIRLFHKLKAIEIKDSNCGVFWEEIDSILSMNEAIRLRFK